MVVLYIIDMIQHYIYIFIFEGNLIYISLTDGIFQPLESDRSASETTWRHHHLDLMSMNELRL